jgi:3-phosphoshikimate 1-carboxyvinyltransferase
MAHGTSQLRSPLYSEDTLSSLTTCQALGSNIQKHQNFCQVEGTGGILETPEDVLDLKNSGTTLRLATSLASLAPGYTVLTGDSSLRNRPMQPLLDALQKLKVNALSSRMNGKAPIIVQNGFYGGKTIIQGDVSSQYISSILIAAPYSRMGVDIVVEGEFISQPYVEMTIDIMKKFKVKVERDGNTFHVDKQTYKAQDYSVEGDYSSASYLISAAALTNSQVIVENLFMDSRQGDKIILDIVEEMGAQIEWKKDEVRVQGDGHLEGITVNLKNSPDLVPTVAVLGALAHGETLITGVEHARFKETDRLSTTAQELKKLGAKIEERKDGLKISGRVQGGVVSSHLDHRLAMALSLVGLKTGSLVVEDAEVFQVSFPHFIETMQSIGCPLQII